MRGCAPLAFLFVALLGSAAEAQWTPDPAHGYAKLWLRWLPGFGYHTGDGATVDYGTYHEMSFATYGEVGVADAVAVFWQTDLVRLFFLEDPRTGTVDEHVAPGDPSVGARWRFLRLDRFVMSIDGSVRAPLATGREVQTVYADDDGRPGNPTIGALRLGTGVWDAGVGLRAGYAGDGFYVATGASYTLRSDGYDHVFGWTAEGGGRLGNRVQLRARITGVHPIDTGDTPRANSPSGLGNGTGYVGVALEGDVAVADGWYVGLTLEGGLFFIERQTGGPVVSAYVATDF